jgi:hypothetical protein
MVIFGPIQNKHPWTDQHYTWHSWLSHHDTKYAKFDSDRSSGLVSQYGLSCRQLWFVFKLVSQARAQPTLGARPPRNILIDAVWPKDVPFGVSSSWNLLRGSNPQNPNFGSWIGISILHVFHRISAMKYGIITFNSWKCASREMHNVQSEKFVHGDVSQSNSQKLPKG